MNSAHERENLRVFNPPVFGAGHPWPARSHLISIFEMASIAWRPFYTPPVSQKTRALSAAAFIVMAGMGLSRVLGFVRMSAIAHVFGRNRATDAFIAAFTLPDLLYILVSGGALGAAFIPVFTTLRQKGEMEKAWGLANNLLNVVNLTVFIGVVLGVVTTQLVALLVPGFHATDKAFAETVWFSRLLFPMVLFTTMSGLMNGWLQSLGEFKAPALAWSVYNVVIIAVALTVGERFGLQSLCVATVAGAAAMVLVQVPGLLRRGWRPAWRLNLRDDDLRRVLKLFVWAMLGIGLSQINLMVLPTLFGSFLGPGDIMALQYAIRLVVFPLGMFGSAISMAIYPTLCREAVEDDAGFANTLTLGLRAALVLCVPMTVVFMAAAPAITQILFLTGKFTLADTTATARALVFLSLGLVGLVMNQILTKGFHAHQDMATPLKTGLVATFLVSVPLTWLLTVRGYAIAGVGVGLSVGAVSMGLVQLFVLSRRYPLISASAMLVCLLKVALASLPLAGCLYFFQEVASAQHFGRLLLLGGFSATGAAGGLMFVVLLVLLREESAALALGRLPVVGSRIKSYVQKTPASLGAKSP